MTDLTHGGSITAIPSTDTDRLVFTVDSEVGSAVVDLTPEESRMFGGALLSWGMRRGLEIAARGIRRAVAAFADASERIAP